MAYTLADGTVVESLTEVAVLLQVPKVFTKDVKPGGKYADMVTITEGTVLVADPEEVEDTHTEDEDEDLSDALTPDEMHEDSPADAGTDATVEDESESIELEGSVDPDSEEEPLSKEVALESMPKFANLEELKDFIKDLDLPLLEALATAIGAEWVPSEHAQIHRMRVALGMHHYFFPELFTPKESKKKGKYADKSDAELEKMAKEAKLTWTKSANVSINRMRLIMLLKNSGHLAD